MRLEITPHAVERFIERCAPSMSRADAKACLEAASVDAVPMRERTHAGHRLFPLRELQAALVVKHCRRVGHAVAVTTLHLSRVEQARCDWPDDELEELLADSVASASALQHEQARSERRDLAAELAAVREQEKTLRQAIRARSNHDRATRALRIAVAALRYGLDASEALARIRAIDPQFETTDFLAPDSTECTSESP